MGGVLTEEEDLDRLLALLLRCPLSIKLLVNQVGYSLGFHGCSNTFCTLLRCFIRRGSHGTSEGVVAVEHLGAFALVIVDDIGSRLLGSPSLSRRSYRHFDETVLGETDEKEGRKRNELRR